MASLIVIAVVMIIAAVLVGTLVAVTIAIHLGKGVRSLIWTLPDRPTRDRPLTGSSRRP